MAEYQTSPKLINYTNSSKQRMTKTKRYKIVSWSVVFAFFTSACLWPSSLATIVDQFASRQSSDRSGQADELSLAWQENIDDMRSLLGSQQLPTYLMEENPVLQGDEFDLMSIFTILDHIKVIDGYRLAYVYQYDGMGGYPVMFAYPEGTQPYQSYEEFTYERPECVDRDQNLPDCNLLIFLEVDGSDLGYLQLVLFDLIKDQFYLYWHSGYRDRRFIATNAALDALVAEISDPFIPLTGAQLRKAQRIDPMPKLTTSDEGIQIRAVWFTLWGGFYESTYLLNKDHPHFILTSESQNLVEYDCGISF